MTVTQYSYDELLQDVFPVQIEGHPTLIRKCVTALKHSHILSPFAVTDGQVDTWKLWTTTIGQTFLVNEGHIPK